ncbi:TIGR02302 family protein [Pelagibius sp. Alg239-R121]|uniref:TIGR02302 family protein n=1 Tax=Pelagibius sp. Alg239-R121 TaxID=2993448 RepID=UPI0024A78826|nr:TIGR02302 family protein [Pelagibius sp. Alg239-R121]
MSSRLTLELGLARAALVWERFWPAIWPLSGIAGLFLVIALFDLLPTLPTWIHGGALAILGLAAFWGLWHFFRSFRLPGEKETRRRLEQDSGLQHRPLTSLDDRLTKGDGTTRALWALHRSRLVAQSGSFKAKPPRPRFAALDPFALRCGLAVVLTVALVIGAGDWQQRLARAVTPQLSGGALSQDISFDVWINPPGYTRRAPQFLAPASAANALLNIPAGSQILAQVQGPAEDPELLLGPDATRFDSAGVDFFKVSAQINGGDRIAIVQNGRTLAEWPMAVVSDAAPTIAYLTAPSRSERAALRLQYQASDDYGVDKVRAQVQRLDKPETPPFHLELALPKSSASELDATSYHDLTPHPWAGLAVEITLIAEDALGQQGQSEALRTVLPERIFNHPVARALVELRKELTLAPEERFPIVRALRNIYQRPDHFHHDVVVALAVITAERRLIHDARPEIIPSVQQLLWDTALRLEEGELAIAERDIRNLQKALQEALARGADAAEIEALLDKLQEALDRFVEAMNEQMREQLSQGMEPQPLPPDAQLLDSSDLNDLIEKARELARNGSTEAAQELLAQLQEILENMRAGNFAEQMNKAMQDAHGMMQEMEDMVRRQQELLDRSYEREQRESQDKKGKDGDQRARERSDDAGSQEKLRKDLGEMMRQLGEALGEIPRSLGRAEQSMRDARDALNGGKEGQNPVQPQSRSLDQLQQGMKSMAESFMQQMGQQAERGSGTVGAQPGRSSDPFGRETGRGGINDARNGVKIPEEGDIVRTREILQELRRRRGERQRPAGELEYIDRLLRQF